MNVKFNTKIEKVSIELYVLNNQEIFDALEKDKEQIEKEVGEKLSWQPLPNRSASRIELDRLDSKLENEQDWKIYIDWCIENNPYALSDIRDFRFSRDFWINFKHDQLGRYH